jgi:SAM-dependent MidA family methyltransferase
VVARALDAEWARLDRPDPFVVVEAGAGRGMLARAVLGAGPECAGALRYVCVERSARLRAEIEELVVVEPPATVLGLASAGVTEGGGVDDDGVVVAGSGPSVTVLDDLPAVAVTGVVLANELLDNLAFRLLERADGGWLEVFVGLGAGEGAFAEVLVEAPTAAATVADRLAPGALAGARVPLQAAVGEWLAGALSVLDAGRLVAIDYADTTASLASRPWRDWLRTYRGHGRGGSPLGDPGDQDLTCEVAVDQLARVRPPDADRSQAEWLVVHGIDELEASARATWHERAAVGDLAALAARSRVGEAAALGDPAGLGAFRVLEWVVDR